MLLTFKILKSSLVFSLCVLFSATQPAQAETELKQSTEMAAQTRWLVNTIGARHYLRDSILTLDGTEIVEAYIESFDYSHMYFQRPEIDNFIFRFAEAMEELLEKGNLYAAFQIYDAYRSAAKERTEWVYQRLEQDFDFTTNETFKPDRREAVWPADQATADALWERRLKYELLNEMLSLASESEKAVVNVDYPQENAPEVEPPASTDDEEDEKFDPKKVQRLLEDPDFFTKILDEAREKIRRRYERNLTYISDRDAAEVQEAFVNAMTQLFDPHSSFLSADTLESFNSAVQNSFVGIGALLQDEDGICTIKEILPGGPAERSGLLGPEDQILGVAQGVDGEFEDVVDMQLRYIVRKIKGEKNTVVRLLIHPGDASDPSVRKDISITRDEVKMTANLASAKLITLPKNDHQTVAVGVIELPSFYGNIGAGNTLTTTSDDMSELIDKLQTAGAQGLILDLRMNGGGLLSEAVRVVGLFIPVGPVVQVRDKDGRTDVLSDRDPSVKWDGPLIVLTSRFSASASEIVAGALQDHDRALVVGNISTHGKGTVQEVYHMNSRPAFSWFRPTVKPENETPPVASKITIKQFYLPDGSSTQVKGVPSDIVLPSVNEFLPIGEDDLPHALPWDEVAAVEWVDNWEKLDIDSPQDPELKAKLIESSLARQESEEEFLFLQKQIDWRRKLYDEKEISINLEKRIAKKINDQKYIEELDEVYDALSKNDYPTQTFKLAIAEQQDEESRLNLLEYSDDAAENDAQSETSAETEEEEEEEIPYDIYLRESARIMADWISAIEGEETAAAQTSPKKVDAL